MRKPKDVWPRPNYNVGPQKHLHALGVIAVCFNALELGMRNLFFDAFRGTVIPKELYKMFYFAMNEDRRLEAVPIIFRALEKDQRVLARIENVVRYFDWCKDARNQLIHAEYYPSVFLSDNEKVLHLARPIGRKTTTSGYFAFNIRELRAIADKIQKGRAQCAAIRIFLRYRHVSQSQLPLSLKTWVSLSRGQLSLPQKLPIPLKLRMSPHPPDPPMPQYLQQSSDE